ncbi:MAG TPA: hypothetical protein VMG59_00770 [Phycisphaerae bacterium]|nr:hypothetical protein [Phycisphaerae bacterium]
MPTFGMLIYGILMVLGGWWCKEIFQRLPEDVANFRQADNLTERLVIIGFWVVTFFVLLFEIAMIYGIIRGIITGLKAQ